jgi:hypothetical protein
MQCQTHSNRRQETQVTTCRKRRERQRKPYATVCEKGRRHPEQAGLVVNLGRDDGVEEA